MGRDGAHRRSLREEEDLIRRIEAMYARHAGDERMGVLRRLSLNHLVGRPAEPEDGEGGSSQ